LGVSDVINSVNFARDNNLLVSVRGGGHNVAGISICDGGLMIDLSLMKGVRVDPANRTARAEPGVTWGDLDRETQAFGMITPGGIISTTGIAGLTLGGGVGWLVRKHGLTCDNLLSADVVTAEGKLITASATQNADLFWGLRGGGVTLELSPPLSTACIPTATCWAECCSIPGTKARDLLRFYRDFMPSAPEDLGVYAGLLTAPDGQPVAGLIVCYSGPLEKGDEVIRPLREFSPPMADLVGEIPHLAMQTMLDGAFPAGNQNYWKSTFLTELSDKAIDILIDCASRVTSPLSAVVLEYYGGASSRVGETETAFPHRRAQYDLGILAQWASPAESEQHVKWARDTFDAIQQFSSGNYLFNFLGLPDDQKIDQVRAAFGQNYPRLVELKNKYDPTNFFRLNPNIKPTV
ncbi:MAG: FAD-dependent oxidoreductase, partial [Chloroflexi bacterium]|nr:FAD-dependent oxidoreductase [Chloroflexota bacterium]